MGRLPCCDKVGIKKGPWTPEEDVLLAAYIQKHGPQNWRSVPCQTGLMRCSKSCRLRWTNYLRPGIKRGNFTLHEEKMIINLQSLLGNKWAAIASYLPQRTDNDIKNYWNTHLKKKIKKQLMLSTSMQINYSTLSKMNYPNLPRFATFNSANYALSIGNISRLLEGWMKSSSTNTTETTAAATTNAANKGNVDHVNTNYSSITSKSGESSNEQDSSEDLDALLSFENPQSGVSDGQVPPLSPFDKWLTPEQLIDGLMEISDSIF